jgi:hypothetical protein
MRKSAINFVLIAGAIISALALVFGPPSLLALTEHASSSALSAVGREEVFAEKDAEAGLSDEADRLCMDGSRIAWRTKRNGKWAVVVNGQDQGMGFDEVKWFRFSNDCKHFSYAGRRGKKWIMMLDGEQLGPDSDGVDPLTMTADGRRWAYLARRGKKLVMVHDGKESGEADAAGEPVFSHDGEHIIRTVMRGNKWMLLLDEKEMSPELDYIGLWRYMGETNRVAFVGRIGGDCFVYLDGKQGPPYTAIGGLIFSRDGSRFAYAGANVDKRFKARGQVIVDGKQGPEFPGGIGAFKGGMLREQGIDLSLGYFANLLEEYHGIAKVISSGDTWNIAYISRREKGERIVVLNDQSGPPFEKIMDNPVFSTDGQHFAYVAKDKGAYSLVRGTLGTGGNTTETKIPSTPSFDYTEQMIFSPDNSHLAFVSVKEGIWKGATIRAHRRVWFDGQPGRDYDALGLSGLLFSHDSKHLAYVVHDPGNKKHFIVLDGQEGKYYDEIFFGALRFNVSGEFVYFAREGRKYLRVTHPIS